MSLQAIHVLAAYCVSGATLGLLALWVFADGRARLRDMARLEDAGERRRSGRSVRW